METTYYHLLAQVSAINKKYESILSRAGEDFNVFRILKLEASENRIHSALLAEFLNPKGSHGQKDVFLKLFIKAVFSTEFQFQTENALIVVEKHIGFTNIDKTEGGRIDIYLDDQHGHHVLIENKIYAGDQENQLVRYRKHDLNAKLLYLNLDGKEASEWSKKDLEVGKDFQIITYKTDILQWLENCRKEAVELPVLRESFTQYIHLIKYLTGQTMNETMSKELIDLLLKDRQNLDAAFKISSSLNTACEQLLFKLKDIIKEIGDELGLMTETNINMNRNYSTIYFYKNDWKLASIAFQFQGYDKKLAFGIVREELIDDLKDKYTVAINDKLKSLNGYPEPWWPFKVFVEAPYDNWASNTEPWLAIMDDKIKDWMKGKVVELLNLLGDTKL